MDDNCLAITNTTNDETLNRIKQAAKTYMYNMERGMYGRAKRGKRYLFRQIDRYVVASFVSRLSCISELNIEDKAIFVLSDDIIDRKQLPYHINFKRGVYNTKIKFQNGIVEHRRIMEVKIEQNSEN